MEENTVQISLKKYKESIDDLRGSLLGLDKTSEDYAKIQQEIYNKQQKYNEVLAIGKKNTDGVDGSLNKMRQQLSQMTKDLQQNYEVGTKAFEEQAKAVKKFADEVSKAEESYGDYRRNVGNYANSITEAFNSMAISLGGAVKGFVALSSAQEGLHKVWTLMAKHPFLIAITVLLGALIKIKDAIKGNEESQKRWEKAMSAFKPLGDLMANIMDRLANGMVWFVEQVSKGVPVVLKIFGGLGEGIAKVAKAIVETVTFIPITLIKTFQPVTNIIGKALGGIVRTVGKIADALGADNIAKKIKSIGDGFENVLGNADKLAVSIKDKVVGAIDKVGRTLGDMGRRSEQAVSMAERSQKLEKQRHELEVANSQSELKQAQLRDKIAKASGEERIRLQKELRKEIEATGKKNAELARQESDLAKEYAKLTPNSAEDNARLRELEANANRVEASYITTMAGVDKQITKGQEKINKKVSQANEKANKELLKQTQEYVKEHNAIIEGIKTTANDEIQAQENQKTYLEGLGKLTVAKELEIADKEHEIRQKSIADQQAELKEMLTNKNLNAEQRLQIENRYNQLTTEYFKENAQSFKQQQDLKLKAIKEFREEQEKQLAVENTDANKKLVEEKVEEQRLLIKQYEQGEIDYETFKKRLADIDKEYSDQSLQNTINNMYAQLTIKEDEYNKLLSLYGEGNELVIDAHKALEEAQTAITQKEAEKRIKTLQEEEEKKIKAKEIYNKSLRSITNNVLKIWSDELKAQTDNGKMSEKNAKKQFEIIKMANISLAIADTWKSAQTAFKTTLEAFPAPFNMPLAIAATASAVAQGLANVQQIKNTKFGSSNTGSSSSSGGVSTMSASVNPLLDERVDSNTALQNISDNSNRQQETRVYVLESDISEASKKVDIRESNSFF